MIGTPSAFTPPVAVTGTPNVGQVPTATAGTTATWQTPSSFDPASPGAIGGTTPAAITGTTITANTLLVAPSGSLAVPGLTVGATGFGLRYNGSALYLAANGESIAYIYGTGNGRTLQCERQFGANTLQNTFNGLAAMTFSTQDKVIVNSGMALRLGNAATTGLTDGVLAATTNASIVIEDSTGQAYRIPCII